MAWDLIIWGKGKKRGGGREGKKEREGKRGGGRQEEGEKERERGREKERGKEERERESKKRLSLGRTENVESQWKRQPKRMYGRIESIIGLRSKVVNINENLRLNPLFSHITAQQKPQVGWMLSVGNHYQQQYMQIHNEIRT